MTLWAVIPVKPISEGKSRLANALAPAAREKLNQILFRQTLDAVATIIPMENIIVVSRDAAVLAHAASRGARPLPEQGDGLNNALTQAAKLVANDPLLAISTDLPGIAPEDVRAMLAKTNLPRSITIAPDRARRGTNALFTAPAASIAFHFGENSFAAHLAAASQAGIEPEIINRPGLAFDLDLPEDLLHCPAEWFTD